MNVDDIMNDLIRREGGFTMDKRDKAHYGKAVRPHIYDSYCTNMGITQETLSVYYKRQATVDEVRNLSKELAREIYFRAFLTGPSIQTLPEPIVPFVFDCAVNHGPDRAVTWVQEVCNSAGFGPINADGQVGPKTRDAAYKAQKEMGWFFLASLLERRHQFFQALVAGGQKHYENGWMRRLLEFYYELQREAPPQDPWLKSRIAFIEEEAK